MNHDVKARLKRVACLYARLYNQAAKSVTANARMFKILVLTNVPSEDLLDMAKAA
jgi:uncharacterized membrane protein